MDLRPGGPSRADRTHSVQFYDDEASFIDELSCFIGTALVAGDSAVVIATKEHRDSLAQALQSKGLDLGVATDQGRYVALDASETLARFMRDGRPDAALFTENLGDVLKRCASVARGQSRQISAFGEMVALLWAQGNGEAAVRLEKLWNHLAETHPLSLRCAYPISGFARKDHGEAFLNICAEHSNVIPAESYTALTSERDRLLRITHLQQKALALRLRSPRESKLRKRYAVPRPNWKIRLHSARPR